MPNVSPHPTRPELGNSYREIFSDSSGSQLLRSAEETIVRTEKAWEHLLGLEDEDRKV